MHPKLRQIRSRVRPRIAFIWRLGTNLALTALISGYPFLAGLLSLAGADDRSYSIAYRGIVLILGTALIARNFAVRAYPSTLLWIPLGAFWILYAIRLAADTTIAPIALHFDPNEYLLFAFGTCLVPMLALSGKYDDKALQSALPIVMLVLAISCVTNLYAGWLYLLEGEGQALVSGRLESLKLNPIGLGHIGVSLTLLSLFNLLSLRTGKWLQAKPLLVLYIIVGIVVVLLSGSRGPVLALVLGLIAITYFSLKGILRWGILAGIPFIFAVAVALSAGFEQDTGFAFLTRFSSLGEGGDDPSNERLEMIRGALKQFSDAPLLGDAIEEKTFNFYPHNVIVESLMAVGVVGTVPLLFVLVGAIRAALRLLGSRVYHRWLALLFFQSIVGASFSGSLYSSDLLWGLLGVMLAVTWFSRPERTGQQVLSRGFLFLLSRCLRIVSKSDHRGAAKAHRPTS